MWVHLTLYSMQPWQDRLEPLVNLLDAWSIFRPQRWDIVEPPRHVFSKERLVAMADVWTRREGLLLERENPRLWISLEWWTKARHPGRLAMEIEDRFFANQEHIQAFLDFSRALFAWGDMVYGFAAHEHEYEEQNVLPVPTMVEGKLIKVGGTDIRQCLPGVYWANFFGKEYVRWFGENLFLNAPCYRKEPLPDKGWLVLTAPTPLAYDRDKARQLKSALRRHLGKDAFFDKAMPTRPCRSPYSRCAR